MELLERRFHLREAGTSLRREVVAGLVTFATLSYILFVQPTVMGAAGMDRGGALFATCVASALACFLMAWWANHPFALAPAMGHNFYFAYVVCGSMGFRWQEALAANLLAGLAFLALVPTGLRERVMEAVPPALRSGIAAGIGMLIALIGLEWSGIVVDHPATLVQLGDLSEPLCLLSIFGLALCAALLVARVPAALLLGMLGTAAVGWLASRVFALEPALVSVHGVVGDVPSPAATAFQLDFAGLFRHPLPEWLTVLCVFLFLDLFDTVGSLLGLGRKAGVLEDGRLPRARGAFAADAVGTAAGACLGTSTVTSYVESAAGIAAGGRTGLTAAVVGTLFLLALFFAPLVEVVGAGVVVASGDAEVLRYPVIAPVLVIVGALMMGALADVAWEDGAQAVPAFLTAFLMPLTFSITEGIAWGFIATSLLSLVPGARVQAGPLVHVFALLFVLRYAFLV